MNRVGNYNSSKHEKLLLQFICVAVTQGEPLIFLFILASHWCQSNLTRNK